MNGEASSATLSSTQKRKKGQASPAVRRTCWRHRFTGGLSQAKWKKQCRRQWIKFHDNAGYHTMEKQGGSSIPKITQFQWDSLQPQWDSLQPSQPPPKEGESTKLREHSSQQAGLEQPRKVTPTQAEESKSPLRVFSLLFDLSFVRAIQGHNSDGQATVSVAW